jgi:HlyD family secretion protein
MEVQISPSTVKPEEFGFMLGEVKSVSLFPSTPEGMQRVLRNDQLVKELSQRGSPIEVTADLLLNPATRSGYKWSSPQGPPIGIFSGTLCTASIVVDRKRPVEYVIPKIKETLGIQ